MRGVLKAKDERARNDAYFTPDALARAVCERLEDLFDRAPHFILEPGAGGGAFLRAACVVWPEAARLGLDLEPQALGVEKGDFLAVKPSAHFSLVVGNPPYNLAEEFVDAAMKHLEHGGHAAFLLRLSFLGGQARARTLWGRRNLRWLIPITPRPSFTPDGKTDASEYAIFVWRCGWLGNAEIDSPLWWEPRPKAALTDLFGNSRGRAAKPEEAA